MYYKYKNVFLFCFSIFLSIFFSLFILQSNFAHADTIDCNYADTCDQNNIKTGLGPACVPPTNYRTCACGAEIASCKDLGDKECRDNATGTLQDYCDQGSSCKCSPVLGCVDPAANNYNSSATQDDGSCTYDANPPPPPPVTCGDGNKDPGEQCDLGKAQNNGSCPGGCSASCLAVFCAPTTCGNGSPDPGEACDSGNNNGSCPRDCSDYCTVNSCSSPTTKNITFTVTGPGTAGSNLVSYRVGPGTYSGTVITNAYVDFDVIPNPGEASTWTWTGPCSFFNSPLNNHCFGNATVDTINGVIFTPIPVTGTINPANSSCVVAVGQSSCSTPTLTWSTLGYTNNYISAVTSATGIPNNIVGNSGSGVFSAPHNPLSPTVRFHLYNSGPSGTPVELDFADVATSCAVGTIWNGTVCAFPPAPTVTLSAAPASVVSGGSSILTWTISGIVNNCTASGDWSGSKNAANGTHTQSTGPISSQKFYTLSCTGPGGTRTVGPVTVDIIPPPVVSLTANPVSVLSGGSSTLTWQIVSGATSCNASGDWSGSKNAAVGTHTQSTGAISSDMSYTLTCVGDGGSTAVSTTVTVTSQPDIAPGPITPTTATVGMPFQFRSSIRNNGAVSTGASFSNSFRVSDKDAATTIAGGGNRIPLNPPSPMSALGGGNSAIEYSPSHIFLTPGTYAVRILTDVGGLIAEGNEGNNNTVWVDVDVSPAAVDGSCGDRATSYPSGTTVWPGGSVYCFAGTPTASPAFPTPGNPSNWFCNGSGGGSNSGQCTASVSSGTYNLNVIVNPGPGGIVTSDIGGINCGSVPSGTSACSRQYTAGTTVKLTAKQSSSYWKFNGWTQGPCTGSTSLTCNVTVNSSDVTVSATFVPRIFIYKEF